MGLFATRSTEELVFINKSGFHGQEKWARDDLKTSIFRFSLY